MIHRAGNAGVVDLRLFEGLDFLSLPRILACSRLQDSAGAGERAGFSLCLIYFRDFHPITLGSRGYFFLIDTDGSRRSRVNEAQRLFLR